MYDSKVENSKLIELLHDQLCDFKCKYPVEYQDIFTEYQKIKIFDNNSWFYIITDTLNIISVSSTLEDITWFDCIYEYSHKQRKKLMYKCIRQPHGHPNYTSSDLKLCNEIIPKLFPKFTMDPYCTWIEVETK